MMKLVGVDPGNGIHKMLRMVHPLVNISRSHQPVVALPLITPHAAARLNDPLDNWQQRGAVPSRHHLPSLRRRDPGHRSNYWPCCHVVPSSFTMTDPVSYHWLRSFLTRRRGLSVIISSQRQFVFSYLWLLASDWSNNSKNSLKSEQQNNNFPRVW